MARGVSEIFFIFNLVEISGADNLASFDNNRNISESVLSRISLHTFILFLLILIHYMSYSLNKVPKEN